MIKKKKKNLVWNRFKKNKLGVLGLVMLITIIAICCISTLFIDYYEVVHQDIDKALIAPCWKYPFGTDEYGRNMLARVLYGGVVSLGSGIIIVVMEFVLAVIFGGISGYVGGKVDTIIMRFLDVFMSVPAIIMEMVIIITLGQSLLTLYAALTLVSFPAMARLVRSTILTVSNQDFVDAAKCYGAGFTRIMLKHIIRNGIGPVIVFATLSLGNVILAIAGMGFIGLGIPSPTPEWGTILAESRDMIRYYPYLGIIPGLAIGLSVMALNFVGDGIRDALDPRTKK